MPDTKTSGLGAVATPAATDEFPVNQAGTSKKMTLAQIQAYILKRVAAATTAAGDFLTWLVLAANSADITGTGLTTVMSITALPVGRYAYKCQLVYQTTATTTGIDVAVNFTGTATQFVVEARYSGTLNTATDAAASEVGANVAGSAYSSQGSRTKNAIIGAGTISVDAINSDMIMVIEGFLVVSVTGDLEIKLAAEAAALVTRAMQGSVLELHRLS